jgi:hypothetical protein
VAEIVASDLSMLALVNVQHVSAPSVDFVRWIPLTAMPAVRSAQSAPPSSAVGSGRQGEVFDDHISWPTATPDARDLACDAAGGYSVGAVIDGKEKVYGSIP